MITTEPRNDIYMNSSFRFYPDEERDSHFYSVRNKNLITVSDMEVGNQYIVDGVAKTLTGKEDITSDSINSRQHDRDSRYKLTFNDKDEESVERYGTATYKKVVSDKDKDEDKDKEQPENDGLMSNFLELCKKFSTTAEECIMELSAELEKYANNTYTAGGKRKSRRNRKSKKSRKGKSRKNRRKSNRRR